MTSALTPSPRFQTATLAIAGVTLCLCGTLGCAKEDDGPPAPRTVTFEGSVDSKYVGHWRTADKNQGLDLSPDGHATILASQPTPHGNAKTTVEGQWLASGDSLILKYPDSSKQDTVIKYKASLAKGALLLSMMGGRLKMTYLRQP